jgi:hypothetical protein
MVKKKHNQTKAEREAGAANLAAWKATNPGQSNLKHGAHSVNIKKRY